ncbi:hypothetical protein E2R51_03690 [Jeotgalibacillus sp. S-D1]|uniref:spore coat protein n=1 Tax=Jeotgalibacillus sp. S-D1 TaxID=2552189 RepID=UPI001059FA41|nr:spore coat protein [Jeotgalibacillus sp. S-D1]TDL34835.1 hypothetical protein E2R51_03690 [Jeotgalibacillus sp. S-D1]
MDKNTPKSKNGRSVSENGYPYGVGYGPSFEEEYANVQSAAGINTETQGLFIRNSHDVEVTQTEVQTLVLVQTSLQAAIEAAVLVFASHEKEIDTSKLEEIAQSVTAVQFHSQNVVVEDSDGITIRQTEVQTEVVVQTVIKLIAQLVAKLG